MRPETRYAVDGDAHVAYQVFGEGNQDVVFISNWMTNIDAMWDEPTAEAYFNRLASFSRVINFDKRGVGVSDPVPLDNLPRLERMVDDLRIVVDAVGSSNVALLGDVEGGQVAAMFAATHPERTSSLILVNSLAKTLRSDDYPIGMPRHVVDRYGALFGEQHGTTGRLLDLTAPSVASDRRFREWWIRYTRLAVPPATLIAFFGVVT